MGCAFNWLIPPAVLYNNPGITREEFVELLNETRTGDGSLAFYYFEPWEKAPWDFIGYEDLDYHRGLFGLAEILGLKGNEEFKKIKWKDKDFQGVPLDPPFLYLAPKLIKDKWEIFYEVTIHTSNKLLDATIAEGYSDEHTKVGDIFLDDLTYDYFVDEVIEHREITKEEQEDFLEREDPSPPKFFTKIKGRPIHVEQERHRFCSFSSLLRKYPYFDPDFMFDWLTENGIFSAPL